MPGKFGVGFFPGFGLFPVGFLVFLGFFGGFLVRLSAEVSPVVG
jgi:hypothetical protein